MPPLTLCGVGASRRVRRAELRGVAVVRSGGAEPGAEPRARGCRARHGLAGIACC